MPHGAAGAAVAVIHVQAVKQLAAPYWQALRLLVTAALVTPAERRAITKRIHQRQDQYTRLVGRRRS